MLFNSYIFILFFLPVSVMGYFIINKHKKNEKGTADLWWLFLVSSCFYAYANPVCLILLLLSIGVNYFVSLKINAKRDRSRLPEARRWMISGVVFNVALLVYFKYFEFFVSNLNQLFRQDWTVKNLIVPLGISFFTFKQIAYIVDCYREKEQIRYQWIEYANYVMFFPQVISGPIGLHYEFIPQMRDNTRKTVNYDNLSQGLFAVALGLGKKVLIADSLSKLVAVGYADVENLSGISAWFVMLAYTLQIYFDFSGYSDVALGIEKMLNLEPVLNFNSPYKAKTVGEFWNRWHMSLTRFFTRYVYIPLGGSRKGKVRTYINTMIVFLISGLWHGANWTFILWGFFHGLFMTIEKIVKDVWKAVSGFQIKNPIILFIGKIAGTIYTFLFVNLAWVLFRASSVEQAKILIGKLFATEGSMSSAILDKANDLVEVRVLARLGMNGIITAYPMVSCVIIIAGLILGVFLLRNTQEKIKIEKYGVWRSVFTIILIVWSVISFSDVSEFLYFNF